MKKQLIKSKYELSELVSEDIISFCYVGKTHYLDHPLIIWEYKAEYLTSALVTRLINVAEKLVSLSHSAALKMIDYHYDGRSFFTIHEGVSQFVTLDTYIKQSKTVDLKSLWNFSTVVLNFLLELEQNHLICGSINFSNIIITDKKQLKFSRTTIPLEIYKAFWKELTVIEDCIFLSPEFILNTKFKSSSDMYAFGVLLYVFFSQKWPYKYSIKIDQMKKSIIEGPKEFSPVHLKIPDQLGRVIEVCLSPDSENRFRSFVELIKVYKGDSQFNLELDKDHSPIKSQLKTVIKEKKHSRLASMFKGASVVLSFVLFFFILQSLYFRYIKAIPEVSVPHVIGTDVSKAEQLLDQYQLRSIVGGSRFHPYIEEGNIIESKPPAGRIVKENRVVRLFVSKGVGPTLVPDLIGYSRDTIEDIIVNKGLLIEIFDEKYSTQYPSGTVIDQVPSPNLFIGPSENVKLILSKGYPVDINIKPTKPSFFQDKSNKRLVIVRFFKMRESVKQDVSIFYNIANKKEKIYSDLIDSNKEFKLEFELEKQGNLEIYFNNELAIKKLVTLDENG